MPLILPRCDETLAVREADVEALVVAPLSTCLLAERSATPTTCAWRPCLLKGARS